MAFENVLLENQMLFNDCTGYTTLELTESAGAVLRFRGKFQEANSVNKNKRMYPYDVLADNVSKLEETIKNRGLFGELDHPTDSIIHLANASHLVTKLWWEGNILMGEGEILNTPSGKVLRSLIEGGLRVGISSRGVGQGQVNNEGVLVIGESYKLITFDAVADPSTFSAFQSKIARKETSVVTPEVVAPAPIQNESKINTKALMSYLGYLLEQRTSEAKNKING